jgi:hypothetical protein
VLSLSEKQVYLVNRFLMETDIGGLSGFLYNVSPGAKDLRWTELRATIEAVHALGRGRVGAILEEALRIVESGQATGRCATWSEYLTIVDSAGRLDSLGNELRSASEALWDDLDALGCVGPE